MTALADHSLATDPSAADLRRRHALELALVHALSTGQGLSGLMRAVESAAGRGVWLFDRRSRLVTPPSRHLRGLSRPALDVLLDLIGPRDPADLADLSPVLAPPAPDRGLARRHLLSPVARGTSLFGWLVMPEIPDRFDTFDPIALTRTAVHLANEYGTQQRIARSAWDARAALARQMVRGSACGQELYASAEYLGVDVDLDRIAAYLVDTDGPPHERALADEVARTLGVEVLGARGSHGTTLLIEATGPEHPMVLVHRTKRALTDALAPLERSTIIAGVSSVASPDGFKRAYREAREAVECLTRFAHPRTRVLAVDDLGPARLFLAHSDLEAVERYVQDVLGALLVERPGRSELLRTMQAYFDAGRRVRESALALGVHENTVRLRLAKIGELTGLDASAGTNDQLSMQTALLVLRLQGHPALAATEVPSTGHHLADAAPREG